MTTTLEPGVHHGIPDATYQALPYLRASDMPAAARSMAHLRAYRDDPRDEIEPDALLFGSLWHAVMEGDTSRFIVSDGPINPAKGKLYARDTVKYEEWFKAQDKSKEIVPTAWMPRAELMAASVGRCIEAEKYTANMQREVSFVAVIEGVRCKCRVDLFDPVRGIWADYKSTGKSAEAFVGESHNRQYPLKAAFQRAVIEAATKGSCTEYAWIVTESSPPHETIVWTLAVDRLIAYAGEVTRIIREVAEATRTGVWPGYRRRLRELPIRQWDIPTQSEEIEL